MLSRVNKSLAPNSKTIFQLFYNGRSEFFKTSISVSTISKSYHRHSFKSQVVSRGPYQQSSLLAFKGKRPECWLYSARHFATDPGSKGENLEEEGAVVEEEQVELSEDEIMRIRNKSKLHNHHYRMVNGEKPYDEPKYWTHHTVRYKRRMYGRYGEESGVNPGIMWPTHEDLDERLEFEKVAYPYTLQEMMEKRKEMRRLQEEAIMNREKELEKKMGMLGKLKKEIEDKRLAKEREIEAARAKREALMEEVRRHFGYTVDPRDEKFQEMLAQKEKAQRKQQKEAKKLERQKMIMAKLLEGVNSEQDKGKDEAQSEPENKKEAKAETEEEPKTRRAKKESESSEQDVMTDKPSQDTKIQTPKPDAKKEVESQSLALSTEVEADLRDIVDDIRKELGGRHVELCDVAAYYFDGQGKAIRPLISILMARSINAHLHGSEDSFILHSQKQLALVSEMIHTATLVHDDVIDTSDTRRGKPSVNALYGQKKAIIGGDYILAKAGAMVARLNNDEVTQILARVLEDLVQGEFMQMGANEGNSERFAHYISKTFNKTASLMAYSCKGVAILGGADESLAETAFQYGKNVGIAFQLIDDLLDFVSSTSTMGKPAAADLQLGLATAPVLFAAQKHPELEELIERRFSQPGDVEKALDCVHNSDGLDETKFLAKNYCQEAVRCANTLKDSPYRKALIAITDKVINRTK